MPARFRSLTAKRFGAVTVGAAVAVSIAALPAQAADNSSSTLQKAQAATTARINARLTTLHTLQTKIAGFKDLTAGESTTLNNLLSTDLSGLTALETKVNAETTVAAVKADAQTMIDGYRVYLLVAPKVSLTHAAATETDVLARLQKVHDALADRLAKDSTADTTANQNLLADMQNQIKAGDARIDGQVTQLLAIQPSPDATSLEASVKQVRDAATDTRTDIGKAVADAKQVRAALK